VAKAKNGKNIRKNNNNHLLNYLEKLENYGEIKINQTLDAYYILVNLNSYEDKYD